MLKLSELIIDNKSLGNRLWLTDVTPVNVYRDNKRTDEVTGFRYTVCCADKGFEKIGIKIDGAKLLDAPQSGIVEVRFDGLILSVYALNGVPQIGGRATGIQTVSNTKT